MFSHSPAEVALKVATLTENKELFLIAVDGHGGSGKSTFAQELMSELRNKQLSASIIALDSFPDKSITRPLLSNPEVKTYYQINTARFIKKVLEPLAARKPAHYQTEDWWSSKKEQKTVEPKGVVIIEGTYSLDRQLRNYYNYSIFIDCSKEACLQRASARDIAGGGDPVTAPLLWKEVYFPNEEEYIQREQPKTAATLVVKSS